MTFVGVYPIPEARGRLRRFAAPWRARILNNVSVFIAFRSRASTVSLQNKVRDIEAREPLSRRLLAEGLGTGLLAATVVGSGIMAEQLAGGSGHRSAWKHDTDRRNFSRADRCSARLRCSL